MHAAVLLLLAMATPWNPGTRHPGPEMLQCKTIYGFWPRRMLKDRTNLSRSTFPWQDSISCAWQCSRTIASCQKTHRQISSACVVVVVVLLVVLVVVVIVVVVVVVVPLRNTGRLVFSAFSAAATTAAAQPAATQLIRVVRWRGWGVWGGVGGGEG